MSSSRPRQTARRGGHPGPTRERIRLPLAAPSPVDHRTPGRRAALSQALSKLEEVKPQSQSASSSKLEADKTEPEAGPSTSSATKQYRVSAASLGRYHGPRPHPQKQSQLLDELPAEILDKIFRDETLNARDHLALSGTCTAIRLGYSEQLWDEMEPNAKTPFAHNAFTHDLLHNPGYLNTCASLSEPDPDDLDSKSVGQIDRIWSNALARAANKSVKPGINFKAPCWKARHKTCSCMRTNATLGPSHSKVISNVNNYKTSWGTMTYHYRTLMDFVNDWDYKSERKINPRGEQTDMFRLATVDAAILEKAGGPWNAWKKLKAAQKKPRKRKRADSDSE